MEFVFYNSKIFIRYYFKKFLLQFYVFGEGEVNSVKSRQERQRKQRKKRVELEIKKEEGNIEVVIYKIKIKIKEELQMILDVIGKKKDKS